MPAVELHGEPRRRTLRAWPDRYDLRSHRAGAGCGGTLFGEEEGLAQEVKAEEPVSRARSAGRKPYTMRISRNTVDKLGVKLYDKASAVVAELVANGYDADAETVTVRVPLGTALTIKKGQKPIDAGYVIEVEDDGHGMTPDEAQDHFLVVGRDRRRQTGAQGAYSRKKRRPVMGRKGIGKLAPFGICQRIEVISAGGEKTSKGYLVSHFYMDFREIVSETDEPAVLETGSLDRTYRAHSGTTIRLSQFLPKRVPDRDTFYRQLAVRFVFARPDFEICVLDTRTAGAKAEKINPLDLPVLAGTLIDLSDRPIHTDSGETLPVSGWLALAKEAYKNEEMAGVRLYARGKIVGVTRDFEQPAGFTGEFTMRSYLVGLVEAEWLDLDDGEDLVRTDRQDILWDSDYGQALRKWGAELIKEIGAKSRKPRRERTSAKFLERSSIEKHAKKLFHDQEVVDAALDLARQIGGFAAEDELADEEYVNDLREVILSVAPHKALIQAFREFGEEISGKPVDLNDLTDLFAKTRIAEMAALGQVASERVRAIGALEKIVLAQVKEDQFQELLTKAPWLIEATWTVISVNEALRTFKTAFEAFYKRKTGKSIVLAITMDTKRPDFTLAAVGGRLHIVEIKKSGHDLSDTDFNRLANYVEIFDVFFEKNPGLANEFRLGYVIDLVCDGVNLKIPANKTAFRTYVKEGKVDRIGWVDFLTRARKGHEAFTNVISKVKEKAAKAAKK
jgi:hypothetical protein